MIEELFEMYISEARLTVENLAATGQTESIRKIGKESISPRILTDSMLNAARGGHVETMTLLESWGAKDYNRYLPEAAREGHVGAMTLLKRWGAYRFNWALEKAARGGHILAMVILRDWGATSFTQALVAAASNGQLETMIVLKGWGAKKYYDEGLVAAAIKGQTKAMVLLKSWGATDFEWALKEAEKQKKPKSRVDATILLRKWIHEAELESCFAAVHFSE